jgi:23S rRNA (adenine2503-C2)-methyltransferase
MSSPAPSLPPPSADLLGWTRAELERHLFAHGIKPVHADAIWAGLHRERRDSIEAMALVPPRVRRELAATGVVVGRCEVAREIASTDGHTRKYLLRLSDGEVIETVLMRFDGRMTACISTQVGCAMGCVFCATGQGGFRRNLTAGEIVAQVLHVAGVLAGEGHRLRNIVLMGQGEPLHNYEAVLRAVDILIDQKGVSLAASRITLSTVGLVPGIRRLADEGRTVSLAVSLHGATDEERLALVPVAKRWPLGELMDACRDYTARTGGKIFFEWTLIEGKNDTPAHAAALGRLLAGQKAQVNLIPLNPTDGYDGTPARHAHAKAFQAVLREAGIPSTVRQRRGIDIAAGCGQLAGAERV